MTRSLYISFIIFFCLNECYSQNLTGRWEGMMEDGEKIQVNIKMKKNELCGYTWDYALRDPGSYCKAVFQGWYDADQKMWILMGTSFMENSGGHILMMIRLWQEKGMPKNTLTGTVESKSGSLSLFNMGSGRDRVMLKKTAYTLPVDMPDCFPKIKKPKTPFLRKEATIKPLPKNINPGITKKSIRPPVTAKTPVVKSKTITKPLQLPQRRDTAKIMKPDTLKRISTIISKTANGRNGDAALLEKMKTRKQKEFSHITVSQRNISLSVYDNGVVDNDTVSIFYNGKLIAGSKGLSVKPLVIDLQLDENAVLHEIVMYAENLGVIAPNTALIVVTAGSKRYELHSSASLTENAVLTFEYKPK